MPNSRFSAPTQRWFESTFAAPTAAQDQGWDAIGRGEHTLILAPTGSGKTLAAFLWALDRLLFRSPVPPERERCRVLYVSPLKALTYDVERNLRSPLAGIALAAERGGVAPIRGPREPATRRRPIGATSPVTRPTSSSPHPSRCT